MNGHRVFDASRVSARIRHHDRDGTRFCDFEDQAIPLFQTINGERKTT
jgi:hypothetical protein